MRRVGNAGLSCVADLLLRGCTEENFDQPQPRLCKSDQ